MAQYELWTFNVTTSTGRAMSNTLIVTDTATLYISAALRPHLLVHNLRRPMHLLDHSSVHVPISDGVN